MTDNTLNDNSFNNRKCWTERLVS